MKVAILLTGQLRTFEMLKYLHMNCLIKPYNADVFLSIDANNRHQCMHKNSTKSTTQADIDKAITFFNPIDTFVLTDFDVLKEHGNNYMLYRQYFVVKKAYEMLKQHSEVYDITYDLIIRLRFDQFIFSNEVPIAPTLYNHKESCILYNAANIHTLRTFSFNKKFSFDEVDDNTIYVLNFGDYKHYKYANDQFVVHNHSLVDVMCHFYDNMYTLIPRCLSNNIGNQGCLIESVFYVYITETPKLSLKRSNICGIFIREFV